MFYTDAQYRRKMIKDAAKQHGYKRLLRCPCCGVTNTEAHAKYDDRCVPCGKRYCRYTNYSSLQRNHPTNSRAALLDEIILEYKILKRQGYRVPGDIYEEM